MNKQPYYHQASILFTATREITRDELTELLRKKLRVKDIIVNTIECEEVDAEPGDLANLM